MSSTSPTTGIIGMGLMGVGLYLFSTMTPAVSHTGLITRMAVTGLGLGMTFPVFLIAVQNAFDYTKLGTVTASVQMFRTIGGTLGTALFGGLMNHSLSQSLAALANDPVVQALSRMGGQAAQLANLRAKPRQCATDDAQRRGHVARRSAYQLADGGQYTISVSATDSAGNSVYKYSTVSGTVTGIDTSSSTPALLVNGVSVSASNIIGVTS